jgi:hypothetical protein
MSRVFISVVAILTVSFVAAGAAAQGDAAPIAAQSEPGALVNGVSVCPPNLEGASINAADCAEPAADVGFFVANPNTDNVAFGDTGGDGLVSFPLDQFAIGGENGAEVEIGVISGSNPYGAISGYTVGCTRNGEAMDLQYVSGDVQPGGATLGVRFTAFPGDQVACEWFLSHVADDDGSDDSGDQSTGGPVTALPSTGTGTDNETSGIGVDTAAMGGVALLSLAGVAVALAASRQERTIER